MIPRDNRDIVRIKKISHATYETPDLDGQIAYYTDVLGLTLTAREKDAAFLASTLDHHSVVLRQGGSGKMGQCARIGFQVGLDDDLGAFEKQTAAQGIKVERKSDPEPSIKEMLTLADPKGTVIEVFKRADSPPQKFATKGIVPHKIGHVAFYCKDVKKVTDFYCNVLGFRVSDWMGDGFSFLRCGMDNHTINLIQPIFQVGVGIMGKLNEIIFKQLFNGFNALGSERRRAS